MVKIFFCYVTKIKHSKFNRERNLIINKPPAVSTSSNSFFVFQNNKDET